MTQTWRTARKPWLRKSETGILYFSKNPLSMAIASRRNPRDLETRTMGKTVVWKKFPSILYLPLQNKLWPDPEVLCGLTCPIDQPPAVRVLF
jgi:hypothetical protein